MSRAGLKGPTVLFALALLVSAGGAGTAAAQDAEPAPAEPSAAEQKLKAKEERIQQYLERKEEKRIERERLAQEAEAARALELEARQLEEQAAAAAAEAAAADEVAAEAAKAAEPAPVVAAPPSKLPRSLAEAQAAVRLTQLGEQPSVRVYLDLIDRQQASPQQLAAFGSFLADNGMNRIALIYYEVALRLDKSDPAIWVNIGTLYRQVGDFDKAKSAFNHALSINPADAVARYNLGTILDNQGKYKQALEEYRIALTLDPSLGDPAYNPSAATNDRLLAVKLMLYQDHAGNIGLPLVDVKGGDINGLAPLSPNVADK